MSYFRKVLIFIYYDGAKQQRLGFAAAYFDYSETSLYSFSASRLYCQRWNWSMEMGFGVED